MGIIFLFLFNNAIEIHIELQTRLQVQILLLRHWYTMKIYEKAEKSHIQISWHFNKTYETLDKIFQLSVYNYKKSMDG